MTSSPTVAIIGGGVSGLVCGARLSQLGVSAATVFDTGARGPGGRCSSRSLQIQGGPHIFDHAVQYFTVSDARFANVVSSLHKVWLSCDDLCHAVCCYGISRCHIVLRGPLEMT